MPTVLLWVNSGLEMPCEWAGTPGSSRKMVVPSKAVDGVQAGVCAQSDNQAIHDQKHYGVKRIRQIHRRVKTRSSKCKNSRSYPRRATRPATRSIAKWSPIPKIAFFTHPGFLAFICHFAQLQGLAFKRF